MYSAERFDITARKFHQWVVVALTALAFVLGGTAGAVLMILIGAVMIAGRYRDGLDLFRAFYALVLVPRGLLRPNMRSEDRATRRVARVMGGSAQLSAGLLLLVGLADPVAWTVIGLVTFMIVLDAALDFCALCFVFHQLAARRVRV